MELLAKLGIDWHILLAQIVNFAILLAVLGKFVYKPVMKMLDERKEGTVKAIEREEFSRKKLLEAEADREKILAQARVESQKLIDEAKQDGEEMQKKLLIAAKEEIAKLKADADKRLANDKVKLMHEARRELGAVVVAAVESALGDALDERTQGRMVEQALAAIREGEKKI